MNELHLFAGAGGGILGGILLGHTTVCAVEIEPYPRKVLLQRQRDGILPKFPIWDDVCTFDGKPWRGKVDVICGGFPCQDISVGGKGHGIKGKRSGLWAEMARIISEVRPGYVFVENSPMLIKRGLALVIGDLTEMGYNARWCVLGSGHTGATHLRERTWVLASNTNLFNRKYDEQKEIQGIKTLQGESHSGGIQNLYGFTSSFEPKLCRKHNEVADQMDRLRAIGNGQDCRVAALAWRTLSQ
jgi:DNA (cytosine-5)-methyltransferase 1